MSTTASRCEGVRTMNGGARWGGGEVVVTEPSSCLGRRRGECSGQLLPSPYAAAASAYLIASSHTVQPTSRAHESTSVVALVKDESSLPYDSRKSMSCHIVKCTDSPDLNSSTFFATLSNVSSLHMAVNLGSMVISHLILSLNSIYSTFLTLT